MMMLSSCPLPRALVFAYTGLVIDMTKLWVIDERSDVVNDLYAVEILGIDMDTLADVEIAVLIAVVIGLELIGKIAFAEEVLACAIIGCATKFCVEMNVSCLAAMMTALDSASWTL